MAVAAILAFSAGPAFAAPMLGEYVGKSAAEIAKNLVRQGFKFREPKTEDSSLLEAEVVKDGILYEILADPRTGEIVKITVGEEKNEIPIIKCTERSKFISHLADTYSEKAFAMGVNDDGSMTELLRSKDGESWTIILTTPNGISCKVASGEDWQPCEQGETRKH